MTGVNESLRQPLVAGPLDITGEIHGEMKPLRWLIHTKATRTLLRASSTESHCCLGRSFYKTVVK